MHIRLANGTAVRMTTVSATDGLHGVETQLVAADGQELAQDVALVGQELEGATLVDVSGWLDSLAREDEDARIGLLAWAAPRFEADLARRVMDDAFRRELAA